MRVTKKDKRLGGGLQAEAGEPRRFRETLPPMALSAAFVLLASQLPVTAAKATLQGAEPVVALAAKALSPETGSAEQSETAGQPSPAADWRPPPMPKPPAFATVDIDPEQAKTLAEQWGVKLLGMRLTSAGYMLDFRFRVLDADKALSLFDHRIKPHIVAERSQIKLPVPMAAKVGAFRPTNRGRNIKSDKTYYMIFGNPDRHVKAGEKVTVVIGDFRVENLVVN